MTEKEIYEELLREKVVDKDSLKRSLLIKIRQSESPKRNVWKWGGRITASAIACSLALFEEEQKNPFKDKNGIAIILGNLLNRTIQAEHYLTQYKNSAAYHYAYDYYCELTESVITQYLNKLEVSDYKVNDSIETFYKNLFEIMRESFYSHS